MRLSSRTGLFRWQHTVITSRGRFTVDPAQEPTSVEESTQPNQNEVEKPVEHVDVSNSCPEEQSGAQNQKFAYKSLSVGAVALGVLLAFIVALVGLVSFTLQLAPMRA